MSKKKKVLIIICVIVVFFSVGFIIELLYNSLFLPKYLKDIIKESQGIATAEELLDAGYEKGPDIFRIFTPEDNTPIDNINYVKNFHSDKMEYGQIRIAFYDENSPVDECDIDLSTNILSDCTARRINIETSKFRVFCSFYLPINQFRADDALVDELLWLFE